MSIKKLNESIDNLLNEVEVSKVEIKPTFEEELRKSLKETLDYCIRNDRSLYSIADSFADRIESMVPDKRWWEITDCDFYTEMFNTGDFNSVINCIIDELKPEYKQNVNESYNPEPDEVTDFKKAVDSADTIDDIQFLIYELSDGVAEEACQVAFDNAVNSDVDDIDTVKDEVISAIDMYLEDNEFNESYQKDDTDSIKIDDSILKKSDKFKYQLLDRMLTDCGYFLGAGKGAEKFLWAGNVPEQIAYMKAIYNSFPDNKKPEWISLADIDEYEKKMLKLTENLDVDDDGYVIESTHDYGGAYDIDPSQYFTRDDINEFAEDVVDVINALSYSRVELVSNYLENNKIEVTVRWDGNEVIASEKIDMRKIRKPKDINKYIKPIADELIRQLKEFGFDAGPHYNEQDYLNESNKPKNAVWVKDGQDMKWKIFKGTNNDTVEPDFLSLANKRNHANYIDVIVVPNGKHPNEVINSSSQSSKKESISKRLQEEDAEETQYIVGDGETGSIYNSYDDAKRAYDHLKSHGFDAVMEPVEDISLQEDTIKTKDDKWVNKGTEGTHGKFRTKKQADAQRKAMFANGFKGENYKMRLKIDEDNDLNNVSDIRGILLHYPQVNVFDEKKVGHGIIYYTLLESKEDALRYCYLSDYWGSASKYKKDIVNLVSKLEPYIGHKVLAVDDDTVFTLEGVLIDDQYNSLDHAIVLVEEVDNDKVTESIDTSENKESVDDNDEYYVGDEESGRIYYGKSSALKAFNSLKADGFDVVMNKIEDESINDLKETYEEPELLGKGYTAPVSMDYVYNIKRLVKYKVTDFTDIQTLMQKTMDDIDAFDNYWKVHKAAIMKNIKEAQDLIPTEYRI